MRVPRFKSLHSPWISISGDLESSFFLSSLYREDDTLTNGDFLYKVNSSYKRVTPTQFSELFSLLPFLKNTKPKIILMPRTHIWEW